MTLDILMSMTSEHLQAQLAQYERGADVQIDHFEGVDAHVVSCALATVVEVVADDENNAEDWWCALSNAHKALDAQLRVGPAFVTLSLLAWLETLPGWTNGGAGGAYPVRVVA